jgi:multicomponent Na+:H+ antiporter subunit E
VTRKWPVAGLALAVLWLFVRGVEFDAWNVAEEFVIGLGVGLPIAYVTRGLYTTELSVGGSLRSVPYAVVYVVFFLYELVTANVDVAYRVLAPSMPIDPDVVEVPLRVESNLAITTIANSITLTPGTLTMDYDPERNSLYVHAITTPDRSAVVDPIRRWEDYALVIFDEPRDPGDPVPDPDRRERRDDREDEGGRGPGSGPGGGDGDD